MSSKAHADRLARALQGTNLAEPVQAAFAENRINVLCRVAKGSEPQWVDLLRRMLLATEAEAGHAHAWASHFCRHYFLKGDEGQEKKLVFGWNVSVQSTQMSLSLDFLIAVIKGDAPGAISKKQDGQVMEIELTGVTGQRGKGKNGKGAYSVGGSEDFRIK